MAIPNSAEIVPRHYRPPEIILGGQLGAKIDVWSAGICLFELATGIRPFPGSNQKEMIRKFWENGIAFDSAFLHGTKNATNYFVCDDAAGKLSENGAIDPSNPPKAGRLALKRTLVSYMEKSELPRSVADFFDLISQILTADPLKRPSSEEALNHPFFCY